MQKKTRRLIAFLSSIVIFLVCAGCRKNVQKNDSAKASLNDYLVYCHLYGDKGQSGGLMIAHDPLLDKNKKTHEYEGYWHSSTKFTCDNVESSKTVSFNGRTYTGEYDYSEYRVYTNYATHIYYCSRDTEGYTCYFGVHADTGELVYLFHSPPLSKLDEPYIKNSKKVLPKKAQQYAAMFVDLDEYQMLQTEGDEERNRYHFVRYINGLPSSDRVIIQVSNQGDFVFFHIGNLNAFIEEYDPILSAFSETTYQAFAEAIIPADASIEILEYKEVYYDVSPQGDVLLFEKVKYLYKDKGDRSYIHHLAFVLKEKTEIEN